MPASDFTITAAQQGQRLDHFLAELAELSLSRTQVKRLIENKFITVNDAPAKSSYKIKPADRVKVIVPPKAETSVQAENIPLEILFEDDDIIVVNKPKGLVTHPAPGNYSGTLVNALLGHTKHLAALGSPLRPGIVHRLDKDTSGVMVVAKNDAAYRSLSKQIKDRTVEKTYLALVHGVVKNSSGTIEARIGRHPVQRKKMTVCGSRVTGRGSREALTYYKVVKQYKNYTLLEVKIKTGRTHQIRVHLAHIGHPVVGDATYGKKKNAFAVNGQLLHAAKLKFIHPVSGKVIEFTAEVPAEISTLIRTL